MRKAVPLAVAGGVLIASGGVFGTASALAKDIQLTVDSQPVDVRTWSGTVDEVLQAHGIQVGERDMVAPARTEAIKKGDIISVRYARPLNLTIDGRAEKLWTQALTVNEAVGALGLRDESALSVPRDTAIPRSGLDLAIDVAREVTIVQGGQSRTLVTTRDTVKDALAEAGVTPDPKDVITPAADTPLTDGLEISVSNQDVKLTTKTIDVPFKEVRKDDNTLPKGTEKVDIEGVTGKVVETWEEKFVNGQSVEKRMTSTREQIKPVDKVILVGTNEKATASATPSASASATPSAKPGEKPSPSASPSKGVKLDTSPAKGQTCTASMYDEPQMTATGERFNPQAMTAAHKTAPLNSFMKVTNPKNGKTITVRINDRGPYIGGRCIDLSAASFAAIGNPGDGLMSVTIQQL
ncbi:septal ring lytic transglycosylase RlpA family protein [Mariniluteicoccus flavus]